MSPSFWFSWRERRRPPFVYPVSMPVRAVVFEPLFRPGARAFYVDPSARDAAAQVREVQPQVLAGRLETLLTIHKTLESLPTHGIVVLTAEGSSCLTEPDRDALWNAYRVPVFEEVITATGQMVAWECEAHEGLHLAEGAQVPPGCTVETDACACGLASPRAIRLPAAPLLKPEQPMRRPPGRTLFASRRTATYTARSA